MVHPAFIWYFLKYMWQVFKQNKKLSCVCIGKFFLRENVILCKLFKFHILSVFCSCYN
jgi:hypothetical protein